MVLALVATVTIFGAFQLHIIKQYQLDRLSSFLDTSHSSATATYNLNQSEIAIGAGGLTGTGYLKGTQTNLDFVPEQHTDFIFTVVGEELGFVGAVGLLLLFAVLLWRAFRIATQAADPFGTFLATGIAAMFAIQMFVNVGMTMGIMPITGIPLPFVSYGGSALIVDFIAVGLLAEHPRPALHLRSPGEAAPRRGRRDHVSLCLETCPASAGIGRSGLGEAVESGKLPRGSGQPASHSDDARSARRRCPDGERGTSGATARRPDRDVRASAKRSFPHRERSGDQRDFHGFTSASSRARRSRRGPRGRIAS